MRGGGQSKEARRENRDKMEQILQFDHVFLVPHTYGFLADRTREKKHGIRSDQIQVDSLHFSTRFYFWTRKWTLNIVLVHCTPIVLEKYEFNLYNEKWPRVSISSKGVSKKSITWGKGGKNRPVDQAYDENVREKAWWLCYFSFRSR